MTSDRDRPAEPIKATAYSKVDGIETWDLTGEPSSEAFGMKGDSPSATYETPGKPRRVRIVLPGRTVETEAVMVDFYGGALGHYTFGVRTAQLKPEPLVAAFRDMLRQLGIGEAAADDFEKQVGAAPDDQSERVEVGAEPVTLGEWSVNPEAALAPLAGAGPVILSGSWSSS